MSEHVRPGEVFEIEPPESGGLLLHLPWWLIAAAAFAVAELTAHPSIGVIVLCLKFGWNDFLSALWLRRRDPNPVRGKTCSWFYLSSGLWRVCVWSFVLLFLTLAFSVVVELRQAQAGQAARDPLVEAVTCLLVWLVSSAFATLLTLFSVVLAWRRRVKVWVTGSISEARRHGNWPPRVSSRGRNALRWWLITTGAVLFTTLFVLGLTLLFKIFGGNAGPKGGVAVALFGVLTPIGAALAILMLGGRVFSQVGAMAPADCWPELRDFGYPTSTEKRRQSWGLPDEIEPLPKRNDSAATDQFWEQPEPDETARDS